jgi:drug/metabolite transporter (DMT)-like permease
MRWKIGPMQATTAIAVVSLAMLLPPYLLWSGFERLLVLPAPMLAAQIVMQGVLAGAVAVVAYSAAVMALGAGRAALFPALVPGTAILIGIPMTGEWPTPLQWVGVVVVIAGLATALGVRLPRRAGRA